MSSVPSDRPSAPSGPSRQDTGQRPAKEEPEFVNERDLPTEDEPRPERIGNRTPPQADVAGVESAAGEEDPGAALDTLPTPAPTPRSPA